MKYKKKYKYIPPYTIEELVEYLKQLKDILSAYSVSNELYDLETQELLNNEDDVARVVERVLIK